MIGVWIGLLLVPGCRSSLQSPTVDVPPTVREDYDALLHRVVTADGLVDYDLLDERRHELDAYVAWIALPRAWQARRPNWHGRYLNVYNALTLFQVLERGRPDSVLDPRGLLPAAGAKFFYETAFLVNGEWLSLSEIEHERVRQMELDLRDHAALNCASMSCPPLRNELYGQRGVVLRRQLADQMKRWMNDRKRGVRIEYDGPDGEAGGNGVAVFNPIFDWFANDFEFFSAGQDICQIAAHYATDDLRLDLGQLSEKGCPHRFFEYDWSLNDAGRREPNP